MKVPHLTSSFAKEYFSMNSSLIFWELQFSKSHTTPDVVYVPINSSLQLCKLAVYKIVYDS